MSGWDDILAHVERAGGWISAGACGIIAHRLKLLKIQFDGWNVKYVKGEKRESFREGQQNERDREK